jgi:hypothetical protein
MTVFIINSIVETADRLREISTPPLPIAGLVRRG